MILADNNVGSVLFEKLASHFGCCRATPGELWDSCNKSKNLIEGDAYHTYVTIEYIVAQITLQKLGKASVETETIDSEDEAAVFEFFENFPVFLLNLP